MRLCIGIVHVYRAVSPSSLENSYALKVGLLLAVNAALFLDLCS